jgi:hypothetical protein
MQNRPNVTPTPIDNLVDAVNSNLPTLAHGESYKLEQLVGEDYWNRMSKGRKTSLGQAFKALAIGGTLPVSFVRSNSSNKSLYELK